MGSRKVLADCERHTKGPAWSQRGFEATRLKDMGVCRAWPRLCREYGTGVESSYGRRLVVQTSEVVIADA